MRMLDLFCCQGGASQGYEDARWESYGVDIEPQPRYPFPFHHGDALTVLRRLLNGEAVEFSRPEGGVDRMVLQDFDGIHASPPCQLYSKTHRINKSDFPDLIGPTRELLEQTGLPWIIENVEDARAQLREPFMLCGAMFRLETYRHRLFETSFAVTPPQHPAHVAKTTKMGRAVKPGEFMHVVGNFTGVDHARAVMQMDWANRDGLREAIPPAYAEWVGDQLFDLWEAPFAAADDFRPLLDNASELLAMKDPAKWTTPERAFARAVEAFALSPGAGGSDE